MSSATPTACVPCLCKLFRLFHKHLQGSINPECESMPESTGSESHTRSPFMICANGSVRGKKEFEPSSLAAESESLLGPHLEDYWSMEDY